MAMEMEADEKLKELREIEMKLAQLRRQQKETEEEMERLDQRRLDILGFGSLGQSTRLKKSSRVSSKDWQRLLCQTAFGRRK